MSPWFGLGCLLALCAAPTTLSLLALLRHRFGSGAEQGRRRGESAGEWLARQVTTRRLDLDLEVHAAEGLDAYWPGVDTIGLSMRTWHGERPTDLAIAAHELGHALNVRLHWLLGHVLPLARLAQGLAWRAFAGTGIVAWWLGVPELLPLATALLLTSLGVTLIVCLDEAGASRHASQLLSDDPSVTDADLVVARASMRSAGAVYGLDLLGQIGVLVAWPFLVAAWPAPPWPPGGTPGPESVGLALVLVPVLMLRAAQVTLQVWDPEPVTTDFRLFTVMHRESQWEFLTGLAVFALVLLLHPLLVGPVAIGALVLATVTAIGPVTALVRAFAFLPVALLAHALTRHPSRTRPTFSGPSPDGAAPALLALYTDPPWYLRVSWLANLAYVPLLAVLAVRLVV